MRWLGVGITLVEEIWRGRWSLRQKMHEYSSKQRCSVIDVLAPRRGTVEWGMMRQNATNHHKEIHAAMSFIANETEKGNAYLCMRLPLHDTLASDCFFISSSSFSVASSGSNLFSFYRAFFRQYVFLEFHINLCMGRGVVGALVCNRQKME